VNDGQNTSSFEQPGAGKKLTISELCDRTGITHRTARFYEQKRLIASERRGTTRLYSPSVAGQVKRIVALKKFGLSLIEIGTLLRSSDGVESHGLSPARCLQLIERLKARREQVDTAIRELGEIRDILTRQRTPSSPARRTETF
jgi:DNA-binding transcriptional MerR regulator